MKFIVMMALGLLLSTASFAQSEASIMEEWEGFSDPEILSSGFISEINVLPLEGTVQIGPKFWSGSYWASQKGSINLRWNSPKKKGFNYKSPSKAQVASMTLEELKELAPSEKYDLLLGRYDYPMRQIVSNRSADSGAPDWAGICHGWAPAAIFHNEPTPKVLTNPDGIQIPFGSTDIKGLLSYYYARYDDGHSGQMGLRCSFGGWLGGARGCDDDLNAGAFHIIISNKIGMQQTSFLMDVDRYKEVWNQPVTGYKSTIVESMGRSRGAARRAVREIRVKTELFYINESEIDSWEVAIGTPQQIVGKKDLKYRLELDADDKIVGGTWESKERPDFLWNKPQVTTFTGILSELPQLLND